MSPSSNPTKKKRGRALDWRLELGVLRGLAEAWKYAGKATYQTPADDHDWATWAGLAVLAHIIRAKGYTWKPSQTSRSRNRRGSIPNLEALIPEMYRNLPIHDIGAAVTRARQEAFDRVFRRPHFWLMRDLYRFAVGGAYVQATGVMPPKATIRELAAELSRKKTLEIPGLGDLTHRTVGRIIMHYRIGTPHRRDAGRGYFLDWWAINDAVQDLQLKHGLPVEDEAEAKQDGLWPDEMGSARDSSVPGYSG